jgi:hypothetical protein
MIPKQKKFKLFTRYTSIKQQQNKYREVGERKIRSSADHPVEQNQV